MFLRTRSVGFVVVALTLVGQLGAQRSASSALSAPLDIAFQLIGNHVVVPVRFQDRELSFILDTGAGASLIDIDVARELNVTLGQPFRAAGAGPGTTAGALLPAP